jgi:hypothetical protein
MTKKKIKIKRRNAAPAPAPRLRTLRAASGAKNETPFGRIAYTAAGAAGTALMGALLTRNHWHEKTAASVLAAVGAGLAWKGDSPTVRHIGSGAMSAGGAQLALLMIDDHTQKKKEEAAAGGAAKKQANADALPSGALESAFERAKARLALDGYVDG